MAKETTAFASYGNNKEIYLTNTKTSCSGRTRTSDLWLMKPASYHCSTLRCAIHILHRQRIAIYDNSFST